MLTVSVRDNQIIMPGSGKGEEAEGGEETLAPLPTWRTALSDAVCWQVPAGRFRHGCLDAHLEGAGFGAQVFELDNEFLHVLWGQGHSGDIAIFLRPKPMSFEQHRAALTGPAALLTVAPRLQLAPSMTQWIIAGNQEWRIATCRHQPEKQCEPVFSS